MSVEAIKFVGGKLQIINQLLLPHETVFEEIKTVKDGWQAIRQMKVRGAPAIAIVGVLSLSVELLPKEFSNFEDLTTWVSDNLDYLTTARPTAVNMLDAAIKLKQFIKTSKNQETTARSFKDRILIEIERMLVKDVEDNKAIGRHGAEHMLKNISGDRLVMLTHCNTGSLATAGYGTALGVVRALHEKQRLAHVFCTETRPYNQGSRLTAYELVCERMPATLIADSMASITMKTRAVSAVVVGADRVAANGDTANKIGTYQLAIAAHYHSIPFYIAAPITSIDFACKSGEHIPIEERAARELTHLKDQPIAAPGINVWNPAFDVTPAVLITGGIITELGVFSAKELEGKLKLLLLNSTRL